MKAYRDDVRARMEAHGRKPDDCKVLFLVSPILGGTEEEAHQKRHAMIADPDYIEQTLIGISAITEVDFSTFDLDDPLPAITTNGERGSLDKFAPWGSGKTLRQLVAERVDRSIELIGHKPGHDILAIRGDLRRPDLKEKSLPLRTENPLFFSYIIISGHRSMRLKPGRLNAPPAERVSWPGLHWHAGSGRRAHGRGHGRSRGGRVPHHPPRANGSDP